MGLKPTLLVPLLVVPQMTHYVLDGCIWKRRVNAIFNVVLPAYEVPFATLKHRAENKWLGNCKEIDVAFVRAGSVIPQAGSQFSHLQFFTPTSLSSSRILASCQTSWQGSDTKTCQEQHDDNDERDDHSENPDTDMNRSIYLTIIDAWAFS